MQRSSVFLGVSHPHPKGAGPQPLNILGISYKRARSMRSDNRILHGDQTRCGENFYRVDHEC